MEIQTDLSATYKNELVTKSGNLYKDIETLDELVDALHTVFEEDRVNIELVQELMESYKSNEAEWKKFAKFDRFKYTRNLVDAGNGKFNLMVLCWGEGHASPIHDHADAHCFMKMLKGELEEVRYAWPKECTDAPTSAERCHTTDDGYLVCGEEVLDEANMEAIGKTRLSTNDVCYINDSLGLHRVENPSNSNPSVSLHLYCPPFEACHIFNQQTGKKTKVQVTFWSKFGESRDREVQNQRLPEDK